MTDKKPIITICSSANFYKQAADIADELERLGYAVILPKSARHMRESGDFTVRKTWLNNGDDYHLKADFIRAHFDEVARGDAILVLNYEKHGADNYIGGNVLMEMAIAFHLKKPIFVLNELPEDSPFYEEIKGMGSVPLHGNASSLPKQFDIISSKT